MQTAQRYLDWVRNYATKHPVLFGIALVIIFGGAGWAHAKYFTPPAPTLYVLGTVGQGTIVQTVSGSGQVSPEDQVTVNPKASGQISQVLVRDGQQVRAGQALAYIDSTDEYNQVQSAKSSLQNAQLNLQKLQEPPTALSLAQAQNAVANSQTALAKQYQDAYNDVVAAYQDLSPIMSQLQDVETGTEASRGSQWNIDYYQSAITGIRNDASGITTQRNQVYADYQQALSAYNAAYADYQNTNQSSSTSTIQSIAQETYAMTQSVGTALDSANSYIQLYQNVEKGANLTPVAESTTALSTLATDVAKVNGDIATLLSDTNGITSDVQSAQQNQLSLEQLQQGPDSLDLESDQLNIQQQQTALQQAEDDLSDYTITAPISGTVANLDLHVGDTVGSGTAAATIITDEDIAELSLNEVDAAKVQLGQQATLTFDAIPNLSLTGTVVDVSPLGTVTQGVVSYDIQIGFTAQDPRVKPGMTVDADIQSAVHANVLTVPASAIKTAGTQSYVLAFQPPLTGPGASSTSGVQTDQTPVQVPVQVGITDNTNTEITSGLTLGQQIVVRTTGGSTGSGATPAAAATARGGFGGGGFGGGGARGGAAAGAAIRL